MTSHVPDTDKADEERNTNKGGQVSDTASSGSGGSRRGSASTGGEVCVYVWFLNNNVTTETRRELNSVICFSYILPCIFYSREELIKIIFSRQNRNNVLIPKEQPLAQCE